MKQVFVETKAMMGDLTYGKKPKKGTHNRSWCG